MQGRLILIMGVAGCGKSGLARRLAQARGSVYIEADDFHPDENIARMGRGLPLTDEERAPWLAASIQFTEVRSTSA